MATRVLRIRTLMQGPLSASHVDIINESHMHGVPPDSETHLKVVVVSPQFDGLSLLKRHQKVQELLKEELESGLHALSIIAKTEAEWAKMSGPVDPSPKCMGGFGK
ncbi:Protein BolA [Folsomia candida]|uniref:Protein BolA n=2 Tax=Folsomia candida TaxID=158441 RepID=A0A226EQD2_FOLCA|nr:Protein BolA [Folsomia candida]